MSLSLTALLFSAITLFADNNGAPAGASGAPTNVWAAVAVAEPYTSQAGRAPGTWVTSTGSNFAPADAAVDSQVARGVYPGEKIDLWAIRLGKTEADFPTERPFNGIYPVSVLPKVQFGETVVDARSANLVAPGLHVDCGKAPDSLPPGDVKLTLDSGGIASSSKVALTMQAQQ